MQNNINQFTENLNKISEADIKLYDPQLDEKDDEIIKLKEELANTYQYLNDFVYIAAHALKSPVANLNLVTILLEKTNDINEVKSYLQTIKQSIKRLDQTIHGMVLGFQVKAWDYKPKLISLNAVLDSVILKYPGKFECLSAKINCDFENCPEIFYNENIIFEIINIFLQNSFKYKADERELHVDVKSERIDDIVLIRISDNGIGIDLEKHGKDLFQPFKKFSPRSDGNGMGLYLARTLIEKNSGKLEIESKPNIGTTVKCFLKEQQKS
jgi:signal transduction histidine kinase